jgi:capsular polysaccharide biosynthesis protein
MLFSIAAGFILGAGATLGGEYFDRSVRDVRDLKSEFELPVLGKVARIHPR